MKRLTVLILAFSMLIIFVACGGESPEANITNDTELISAEEKMDFTDDKQGEIEEKPVSAQQPDFPETIIVDDENCTVKIMAIETDALWGYTLKVYLENKTDLNLMYSLDQVSVNGYMCDPFWIATVNAGMKANESISFAEQSFEKIGITEVTDITFKLRVFDNEDWNEDAFVEDVYTIYPLGEEAACEYPRQAQKKDEILFDTDECTMIVTGYDPEGMWGYTVNVFLMNKTEDALMFSVNDAAVNGFMCDPFWAEEVAAGKMSYGEITWSEDDFEMNGITEVESIVLPVRVYNSDDWSGDDLISETFELTP